MCFQFFRGRDSKTYPALSQIHDRITNPQARTSILKLRRAIEQAEREVPGLLNVFISEVVDSVEVSILSLFRALSRLTVACLPPPYSLSLKRPEPFLTSSFVHIQVIVAFSSHSFISNILFRFPFNLCTTHLLSFLVVVLPLNFLSQSK